MAQFQLPAPGNIRKAQWGWLPHVKRPDVDKLARALLDPLTGIVWVDDSQVSFLTVNKVYAWEKRPGVTVVVDQLSNDWCIQHAALHRAVSNVITSL
jgi:Holliday junction resolvase RusA-like endonuclease